MTPTTDLGARPVPALERVVVADGVLRAVEQLGLLDTLAGGPVHVDALAGPAGQDTDAIAVLLDALVELGLATSSPDGHAVHPELPRLVGTMRSAVAELPDRVRTGQPRLAGDRPDQAGELYGRLAAPLGAFFGDVAEEVADRLAAPGLRVLDVGAGAAPWTRAVARRHPSIQVVACDLDPVLPATRTAVAEDGLTDQFELVACDVLAEPLPGGDHDLVVAANLCHLFDARTADRLVGQLAGATRTGGTLAIVDALPEHPDPEQRRSIALYAAGLLTRTATGGVHPFAAYRTWLRAAGCERVERYDCTSFPTSLVTARASTDEARRRRP